MEHRKFADQIAPIFVGLVDNGQPSVCESPFYLEKVYKPYMDPVWCGAGNNEEGDTYISVSGHRVGTMDSVQYARLEKEENRNKSSNTDFNLSLLSAKARVVIKAGENMK